MGFDGLYASIRHGKTAYSKNSCHSKLKSVNKANNGGIPKKKTTLDLRVKYLLDKYKDDKETRDNILGELQIYRVNLTLAKEFNDKSTEKKLNKEIMKFLNQF